MPKARLRVCLAGSGGGHLRQLFDLRPAVRDQDYFFVTEDTPLSVSLAQSDRTFFVPHFALGQARRESPWRLLSCAARNFVQSARIILRERPDVLITTGAGAAFFSVVFARLTGARIVVIESFARFETPSLFLRLAAPFADRTVVQSAGLAASWPKAKVFDPLKLLATPRPAKSSLMFVTVGAVLPFDRLIEMVADLKRRGEIPERVLMQVGVGGAAPTDMETVETLPFETMQSTMKDADIVVCHGGTGSIVTALREGCRVVAVPRLSSEGEVYDDHQEAITGALAERGMIAVANTADELAAALRMVRARTPVSATSDPAELVAYLDELLRGWAANKRPAVLA